MIRDFIKMCGQDSLKHFCLPKECAELWSPRTWLCADGLPKILFEETWPCCCPSTAPARTGARQALQSEEGLPEDPPLSRKTCDPAQLTRITKHEVGPPRWAVIPSLLCQRENVKAVTAPTRLISFRIPVSSRELWSRAWGNIILAVNGTLLLPPPQIWLCCDMINQMAACCTKISEAPCVQLKI